jgi:hypothetical protein
VVVAIALVNFVVAKEEESFSVKSDLIYLEYCKG